MQHKSWILLNFSNWHSLCQQAVMLLYLGNLTYEKIIFFKLVGFIVDILGEKAQILKGYIVGQP